MTIPFRSQQEILDLLKENGWDVVSDSAWESHNRVMIGKGRDTFPLQLKKTYYYNHVVILCRSLEIQPPEDCLTCYEQEKAYKDREEKEPGE